MVFVCYQQALEDCHIRTTYHSMSTGTKKAQNEEQNHVRSTLFLL